MRKMFSVALFLLVGFLAWPVAAEDVTELKREISEDGLYREVIDVSRGYGDVGAIQFMIHGGEFKDVKNVTRDTPRSGTGLFVSSTNYYDDFWSTGSSNIFELVISSETGDYTIEMNRSNSSDDAFDLTEKSISNGEFISFDGMTYSGDENFFKVHLVEGTEYYYSFSSQQALDILAPSGETVESYPRYKYSGDDFRRNVHISSTFLAEESGVYTIHAGASVIGFGGIGFEIYELVDDLSEVSNLQFNKNSFGALIDDRDRVYALKVNGSMTYSISYLAMVERLKSRMYLDVFGVYPVNQDRPGYMNEHNTGRLYEWDSLDVQPPAIPVYSTNVDMSVHLHKWRYFGKTETVDAEIENSAFTPKMGDAAKAKVTELNAENRDSSLVADPVDAFAGNFVDNRTLLSYSGNNPLSFGLNYDSIANESKSLGGGFTHNFETFVKETESGLDVYWTPNSVVRFTKDGAVYKPNNKNQLGIEVTETDTGYKVVDKSNRIFLFDTGGKLIEFTDKMGLATNYTYSGENLLKVSNDKGQSFEFAYDADNQVSTVTDVTGRKLTFSYTDKRLSQVVTAQGSEFAIEYKAVPSGGQNFKVSRLTYGGNRLVQNTYDPVGRIISQYDGNGALTKFIYDEHSNDDRVVTTIDTAGRVEVLTHDASGNLLSKKDALGFTETYSYDDNRNMVSETDKNGNITTYKYDSLNRLVLETNAKNQTIAYEYDEANNITKITTADGKSVESTHIGNRLASMTDKLGRETIYEYDSFGNVTKMSQPGKETVNKYDAAGYLVSVTIDGVVTTFENDDLGRPLKTTLPGGKDIRVTYDGDNNVLTSTDVAGNTVTNEYNAHGDKVKSTDQDGIVSIFEYDTNGNLTSEKMVDRGTTYKYNKFNEVIEQRNINGTSSRNVTAFTYNSRGELVGVRDHDGIGYTATYDGNGNLLTKTTNRINETYSYDSINNQVSYIDGKGQESTYSHDSSGNLIQEVSPSGTKRTHTYDAMNRLISTTDGKGNKTEFAYDLRGNLVKETQANGAVTSYEYNSQNQQTAVVNALGERSESRYNALGQLIEVKNALGEIVQTFEYNDLGRMTKLTDGNGYSNEFTYDSKGNLLTHTDALGNIVEQSTYNLYNEAVNVVDGLGNETLYDYGLFGNLDKVTDAKGNATAYAYTNASRLTRTTDAVGTTADMKYDAFGNVISLGQTTLSKTAYLWDNNQNITRETFSTGSVNYAYNNEDEAIKKTNARLQAISYEYDVNGQVIKESAPEGVTSFEYDDVGNQLKSVNGSVSIERTYDLLGRVTSKTQNGSTIGYAYDKRGNLVKMTYPDGKEVDYVYDVVGNLLRVTDWNGKVTAYEYNANNQLVKTTNWNGTTEVREYDLKGQVTLLQNLHGTEVISSFTYEYDANGNIVKENDTTLEYDPLNRLTLAGVNAYTYSAFGNIIDMTVVKDGASVNQKMTYGNDNQLTSLNGLAATVDKDGNLNKYKLNGVEYAATYDSKNRMTSFDGTTYKYDAENNRVGLTEGDISTEFVVDNDSSKYSQVLVETTGDSSKYHVYGHGLIGSYSTDGFETNHHDYRGSVTSVTDETGDLVGSVAYDEYGVILEKDERVTTRFLYNGKYGVQTDANGLYHMRARYYNPDIKRFMNRDVVSGSIEESQTLNRYAFVNGNPISYNDPFGLAREAIGDTKSDFMKKLHLGLDVVGMLPIPIVSEVADITNAGIYLAEGDHTNAALSGVAAIPVVGSAATAAKLAKNAGGVAKSVDKAYNGFKPLSSPTAGDNVGSILRISKADGKLTPSNYPNPDPSMAEPPVEYHPKTIGEVERMRRGKGPTTKKTHGDKNIEAHHRQQIPVRNGGILDELEQRTHRGVGNHTRHKEPSQLTPAQRSKEIRDHYKRRGNEYILPGEGI